MNIFIIGGMSTIFFGLTATLMLLRKKDNSDIMSRRITVIIRWLCLLIIGKEESYEESCVF